MRGIISWNGERSDQYGILIAEYPNYRKPQRKIDRYEIPGRNGDIIMMQDAWENVTQEYIITAGDGSKHSVPGSFSHVIDWLCAPNGYCELWDSFDPDHFRMATFEGPLDVKSLSVGRVGKATIQFDCKPQRYLLYGKDPVLVNEGQTSIHNPTAYKARPKLFVRRTGSGSGTVTIGNTIFTISDIPASGMYIDCEEMNCFDSYGINLNSRVSSNTSDFATLLPGANIISFTGEVQSVEVTPRWFEI